MNFIEENFDNNKDLVYVVLYEDNMLGCFTSELKAQEAIKQYIDTLINSYNKSNIDSIEVYKEELKLKAKIQSFLLDRLYDSKKIEK